MKSELNGRSFLTSALITATLSILFLGAVSCGPSQPSKTEMMNIANSLHDSVDTLRKAIEADSQFLKGYNAVREDPASRDDHSRMEFAGGSMGPDFLLLSEPTRGMDSQFSSLITPYENKSKELKTSIEALDKKFGKGDPQIGKLIADLKDFHKSCDSLAKVATNPDGEKSFLNYIIRYRAFRGDNAKQYALFTESLMKWNSKEAASKWSKELGAAKKNIDLYIEQGILNKDLAVQ
jgi:hypothetical protein